jgi:hypothetical protein
MDVDSMLFQTSVEKESLALVVSLTLAQVFAKLRHALFAVPDKSLVLLYPYAVLFVVKQDINSDWQFSA